MNNNNHASKVFLAIVACLWFLSTHAFGAISYIKSPELTEYPDGRVPLAAVVDFSTKEVLDTHIKITDGTHQWEEHTSQLVQLHFGCFKDHAR